MIAVNREQRLPGSSQSLARGLLLLVRAGPHAVVLAAVPLAAVLVPGSTTRPDPGHKVAV
jgi:hypothetical protein